MLTNIGALHTIVQHNSKVLNIMGLHWINMQLETLETLCVENDAHIHVCVGGGGGGGDKKCTSLNQQM